MTDSNYKKYISENWDMIKENIRNEYEITDISFNTWIKPLKFYNMTENLLTILIPDEQAQAFNYISNKYKMYFVVGISELLEHEIEVSFILNKDKEEIEKKDVVYNIKSENANLNPKYRFESFVIGNNNRFAHSAALAVAESPGVAYNPLFIYGGSGLGKTHLMHSIGHFILDEKPQTKVLYVTSENFTNEIVNTIRSGNTLRMAEIREKYRSVDVLLIDDIQDIIGKDATQREFFNTFNELHSQGKQIVISSDKPPKELEPLEERFRTRFEWGLIADIQAPDYETRMAILQENAKNYGKKIDNEVFDYIATNITTNIRELEGAYNKLVAFSRLHRVPVSMDIVNDALKDIINKEVNKEISSEHIIEVVADYFSIKPDDIKSKRKTSDLVLPRQICMYLCKELTEEPLQEIAKHLNKKDHTTVMHGASKIAVDIKVDKSLANKVEAIKKIIIPG